MSQEVSVVDRNNDQVSLIAKAELDIQISTAKAFPRNVESFVNEATVLALMDPETSESCFYSLKRKDRDGRVNEIKGPSTRLAEIALSTWGNTHAATRVISNDGRTIVVEGVCWDLQKNVRVSKQVTRSIVTSTGKTYSNDMQAMTINAAQSIALRNAIFSVIPKALIGRVYEAAVSNAVGDQKSLNERRQKLLSRFNQMGISESKILAYFELGSIQEIGLAEIECMIGIGTAIKEGDINIDQAFIITDENLLGSSAKEKLEHLKTLKDQSKNEDLEQNI